MQGSEEHQAVGRAPRLTQHAAVSTIEAQFEVHSLLQLRDNCILFSCKQDPHIRAYDLIKKSMMTSPAPNTGVRAMVLTRAEFLVSADEKSRIEIWDSKCKSAIDRLSTTAPSIMFFAELWDGRVAAVGSDRSVYMCEPVTRKLLFRWTTPDAVTCALHLDNRLFATGHEHGDIHLWDLNSMTATAVLERGDNSAVRSIVQFLDGRVASSYDSGVIALWDPFHNRVLSKFTYSDRPVLCLLGLLDGRLVSGDARGIISIWDTTGLRHLESFRAHNGAVNVIIELKNGLIASGGGDKRVHVWDVSSTCSGIERTWALLSKLRYSFVHQLGNTALSSEKSERDELAGLTRLNPFVITALVSLNSSNWTPDMANAINAIAEAGMKIILLWYTVVLCRELRLQGHYVEMGYLYKLLTCICKGSVSFQDILSFHLHYGDREEFRPIVDCALKCLGMKSGLIFPVALRNAWNDIAGTRIVSADLVSKAWELCDASVVKVPSGVLPILQLGAAPDALSGPQGAKGSSQVERGEVKAADRHPSLKLVEPMILDGTMSSDRVSIRDDGQYAEFKGTGVATVCCPLTENAGARVCSEGHSITIRSIVNTKGGSSTSVGIAFGEWSIPSPSENRRLGDSINTIALRISNGAQPQTVVVKLWHGQLCLAEGTATQRKNGRSAHLVQMKLSLEVRKSGYDLNLAVFGEVLFTGISLAIEPHTSSSAASTKPSLTDDRDSFKDLFFIVESATQGTSVRCGMATLIVRTPPVVSDRPNIPSCVRSSSVYSGEIDESKIKLSTQLRAQAVFLWRLVGSDNKDIGLTPSDESKVSLDGLVQCTIQSLYSPVPYIKDENGVSLTGYMIRAGLVDALKVILRQQRTTLSTQLAEFNGASIFDVMYKSDPESALSFVSDELKRLNVSNDAWWNSAIVLPPSSLDQNKRDFIIALKSCLMGELSAFSPEIAEWEQSCKEGKLLKILSYAFGPKEVRPLALSELDHYDPSSSKFRPKTPFELLVYARVLYELGDKLHARKLMIAWDLLRMRHSLLISMDQGSGKREDDRKLWNDMSIMFDVPRITNELPAAKVSSHVEPSASSIDRVQPRSQVPADLWAELKSKHKWASAALDELMSLVGLESVKSKILDFAVSKFRTKDLLSNLSKSASLPKESTMFKITGPPGTGKTTLGRILGKLLVESAHVPGARTVELMASQLRRSGPAGFKKLVKSLRGGVLVIDMTESLSTDDESKKPGISDGEELLAGLMETIAILPLDVGVIIISNQRVSVPMVKYLKELETYSYSDSELLSLWKKRVEMDGWNCPQKVSRIAVHQIARRRNLGTFANAHHINELFRIAQTRAIQRATANNMTNLNFVTELKIEDVLGLMPSVSDPEIAAAFNDLEQLKGTADVLNLFAEIVDEAAANYKSALKSQRHGDISLHRLVVGNRGLHKTQISAAYGRLLKGLGLLSLGTVETVTAGSLLGARLEDTRLRTLRRLQGARGRVLLIDHARVLCDHSLGSAVFEAIVDFCQDGRDSDVAILLSGDPSSLEVTLYSQGPGLANLFSFDQGLYCMDLNENELCSCIIQLADEYGLEFSLSSVNVAMKVLLEHKSRPHFANYDSVRGVVSSSAARMRSRVSTSSALQHTTASSSSMVVTPADVSKESTVHSARLYNMKSIHTQLSEAMVRLKVGEKMTHFTFLGDSGAGHSTIAGILAEHMLELGLIMRSAVVEVSALTIKSDSVTELSAEIESILMDSKGGVLLINDAHEFMCGSLGFAGFNAFIDALHTAEENRTLIVLSGRESIMMDMMTRQPGLMKKFANVIRLPVWSVDVCVDCIVSTTHEDGLGLEALAVEALRHGFEALQERPGWSHVRDVMDVYLDLIVARLTRIQGFHSSSDVVGWCEGVVAPLITFADADTVMRRLLALRPRDVHPTPRYAATATATHVSTATGAMGHAERQARLRYEGFCRTLEESGRPPLTVPRPDVATTPGLAESTNAVHVNPIATENGASGPKSAAVTDVDDACPVAEDAMSSFLGEVPREPTVPPDNLAPPLPSASPSDALEPTSTVAHSVSQPHMLLSHRQRGAFDSFRIRMPSIHGMRTTSTSSLTRRSSSSALHSEPGITSELSESDQEDLVSILSDADESDDDNEGLFADFDKLEAQANIAQDDFARDWNALSAALNEISSATSASGPRQELTAGASFGSGDVSLSDIDGFDESELFFPNNLS